MNKIKFLLFAAFISVFTFSNSMSKTKEQVKTPTIQDLENAIERLDPNPFEVYKEKVGAFSEEEYRPLREKLLNKTTWDMKNPSIIEPIQLFMYAFNATLFSLVPILMLSKILSKQKFVQNFLSKYKIDHKEFDLRYRTIFAPVIVAAVLSPISLGLYYSYDRDLRHSAIARLMSDTFFNHNQPE
ncbi:hypothetical protein [Candidatus Babela massiliensis]|uniref:Uncharacterized protein n=1 Tax=Candidatus Babela massiliensis TaxID=673862 RepID=V6DGZ4_9BACT|nr:hypothetical protein [Candidatus Babela massiliensis]CDK30819.1 hypothetical protein BABL1_gene_196 [Candidatus Babela massiliensis]